MSIVIKRPAARQDLVDTFRYFTLNASLSVARRFIAQAEATFVRLAAMPGMGTPYEPDHPAYAVLRCFPVSRFPKLIVFYRPIEDGIEVIRVLHGARDISGILAEDIGIDPDAPG